ncbi:hypothetical protein FQN50_006532 [Emmonsiellopsis sp. PD_5]|nr:hypothetical protein FQN50_006532 [Emmonsiellopsis sp. PD_5]
MKMRRPTVIYFLGGSSIICTMISTIVNGVFAASFAHAVAPSGLLPYTGMVLTIISVIVLGLLVVSFTRDSARDGRFWKSWRGIGFILLGGVLFISFIVTIVALRRSGSRLQGRNSTKLQRRTHGLYNAWSGIWAVAIVFQALFYVCLALPPNYKPGLHCDSVSRFSTNIADFFHSKIRLFNPTTTRSVAVQTIAYSHQHPPSTPATSQYNPDRKSSKASSDSGQWPGASKVLCPLPLHQQHIPIHKHQPTKTHAPVCACGSNRHEQEYTFDQWDTSNVPQEIYDTLLQSNLNHKASSIKSQPNSSIRTTNNNHHNNKATPNRSSRTSSFASTATTIVPPTRSYPPLPPRTPHEDPMLPASPTLTSFSFSHANSNSTSTSHTFAPPPLSPASPPSPSPPPRPKTSHQYGHHYTNKPLPPPKFPPDSTRQRAHSFEEHIHPLFRSSSPGPPPGTTRGTVVTASPAAGQTISKNALNRIKSGSFSSLPGSGCGSVMGLGPSSPLARTVDLEMEGGLDAGLGADDVEDGVGMDLNGGAGAGAGGDGDEIVGLGLGLGVRGVGGRMALPIPGFVLAAGTRGSWVDYGRRKSSGKGDVGGAG